MPAASRRVELLTESVQRLRSAVAAALGGTDDAALAALSAEVDREAIALHAGLSELQRLSRRDSIPPTFRPPAEQIPRPRQRT